MKINNSKIISKYKIEIEFYKDKRAITKKIMCQKHPNGIKNNKKKHHHSKNFAY